MIKAVLFDFGGVLSPGGKSVRTTLAKTLGVDPAKLKYEDLYDGFRRGTMSSQDFFAAINVRYQTNITEDDFVAQADLFVKNQAVYDMAASLREHGITTGIASNINASIVPILKKQGYYDGFDPVLLSCEELTAKPSPEFYRLAVKRLGLKPQEVLFIDDQEKCLPPAREMGMHVIRADNEQQIVGDIKALFLQENQLVL